MRVLNVNAMIDPVIGGGTAERTFQMSRYITKLGYECRILTTNVGLTSHSGDKFHGIDMCVCPCLWRRFYVPKGCLSRISESVQRADIVHLMGHWTVLNLLAYFFIRQFSKPYVVCPAGSLPIYGRSKLLKKIFNSLIGGRILRNADYCIAVTEGDKHHLKEYGVAENRIAVIPNGISMEEDGNKDTIEFRSKHGLGDSPLLLFMGRLNHIKGPDLLLLAFCNICDQFPKHHLVFAGPDGGMLSGMKAMVTKHGVSEKVHFVGYLGEDEKTQAYRAADLLVLPSRQEPMSIVVLEAGSVGTPAIVTDGCDFNDIERIGGGVVVGASISGIENGLRNLLGDRVRIEKMGIKLQRYVKESFSWDLIVKKYVELYVNIQSVRSACGSSLRQ